jgi:hypothetical protein
MSLTALNEIARLAYGSASAGALPVAALRDRLAALTLADFSSVRRLSPCGTQLLGRPTDLAAAAAACRRVTSIGIFTAPHASMTCFIVPPGLSLPLHDHPGMTVLCRVLAGSMRESAFAEAAAGGGGPYRSLGNSELSAGETTTEVSSLHQFTAGAGSPVIFCDVISPPYFAPPDNIGCTYYRVRPPPSYVGPPRPYDAQAVADACAAAGAEVQLDVMVDYHVEMDALAMLAPEPDDDGGDGGSGTGSARSSSTCSQS